MGFGSELRTMQKSNILVIEPDEARADNIIWALIFLGYYPQLWNASVLADSAAHDWRAVYIGGLDDEEACRGDTGIAGRAQQATALAGRCGFAAGDMAGRD
jgi:hypothetical protein